MKSIFQILFSRAEVIIQKKKNEDSTSAFYFLFLLKCVGRTNTIKNCDQRLFPLSLFPFLLLQFTVSFSSLCENGTGAVTKQRALPPLASNDQLLPVIVFCFIFFLYFSFASITHCSSLFLSLLPKSIFPPTTGLPLSQSSSYSLKFLK